jgi:hypothetical protein
MQMLAGNTTWAGKILLVGLDSADSATSLILSLAVVVQEVHVRVQNEDKTPLSALT